MFPLPSPRPVRARHQASERGKNAGASCRQIRCELQQMATTISSMTRAKTLTASSSVSKGRWAVWWVMLLAGAKEVFDASDGQHRRDFFVGQIHGTNAFWP